MEHVADVGWGETHTGFWWGKLNERDHLEHLDLWEDNIDIDLTEMGLEIVDWIDLAQDRNKRPLL
jgi:hypothetical protein